MTNEERSPLVPVPNNYGSTQSSSHSPDSGANSSDIQVDNTNAPAETEQIDTTGISPPDDQMRSTLSFMTKIGFGFGHVYNDLCAGMWFSYTLLFMQSALLVPSAEAGALMMLGQVGDAIATPIVGFVADRYGTKRKWHSVGTFLVFSTFPILFSMPPMSNQTISFWWHAVYFGSVILIFQLGWAIVQITHLGMIPEMSRTNKDRSDLTALRYAASVISNVIVFIVTWAVLHAHRARSDNTIGPGDAYRFKEISIILTIIGLSTTIYFYFSLSINGYSNRRRQALANNGKYDNLKDSGDEKEAQPFHQPRTRKNFFKSALLYQNAFLYVFARLFMTTALVYIPLWLDERSRSSQRSTADNKAMVESNESVEHIAIIPMISFLSSFLTSMAMKCSDRFFCHQKSYLFGSLICICGCTVVSLAVPSDASAWRLYGVAMLFGIGSSVTMISSLCITADMIGRHVDQSGFIYSAVTFTDKLITGIVVVVIESLKCKNRADCPEYYRDILAYGCGLAAALGLLTLCTLKFNRRNHRALSM